MFDGQVLIRSGSDYSVYSPWFPRGGDVLRVTGQLIKNVNTTIVVRVFTKNSEDVGDGVDVDTSKSLTLTTTTGTLEWGENETASSAGGLEELVRYKFTVSGTDGWALFRMLAPVWFDNVSA